MPLPRNLWQHIQNTKSGVYFVYFTKKGTDDHGGFGAPTMESLISECSLEKLDFDTGAPKSWDELDVNELKFKEAA